MSRDSAVGIPTGYRLDDIGVRVRVPVETLLHVIQNGSGTQLLSYPMGTRGIVSGVKRPGRKPDHSPPTSAEVSKT
jgi:hypothetical protein